MRNLWWVKLSVLLFLILLKPAITKAPSHNSSYLTTRSNHYFHEVFVLMRNELESNRIKRIKEAELERFLMDLGHAESRNNWKITNKYGYIGEWQIGYAARKQTGFGHISYRKFKKNPNIFPREDQKLSVQRLMYYNERILIRHKVYYQYLNGTINGIHISKSALLAASHLGGAGNVKKYLLSKGKKDFADAYGTKISDYLEKFSNYNF